MNLLIDIGNRRIKWGYAASGGGITDAGALHWHDVDVAAELRTRCRAIPARVLVCSVAGQALEQTIAECCRQQWQLDPEFLRSTRSRAGVTSHYRDPAQLGSDRWAALIGLHARVPGHACVIDCGTAVTVDVLDRSGAHLGGAIMPGVHTMRAALARDTYNLCDAEAHPEVLADNTPSAIQGGTLQAVLGGIERLAGECERLAGTTLSYVITGGDAPDLQPRLGFACEHRPHLVLEGLLEAFHP